MAERRKPRRGKASARGAAGKRRGGAGRSRGSSRRKTAARGKKALRKARRPRARTHREPASLGERLTERLTEQVEHVVAGLVRRAVELGGSGIAALLPESDEMRRQAGASIRELRELAGLTREELADALELSDRSVLAAVEAGTATLSFELILRLAALLARHDPVPLVSRLVRTYNPILWQILEDWGVGELPLQLEREREFVNVLRGSDAARTLADEDFAQVLAFTRAAFETALHFAIRGARRSRSARARARRQPPTAAAPPRGGGDLSGPLRRSRGPGRRSPPCSR
jgi:transcriptional regulator with XRE-family HTH domain